MGKKIT
jgi:dynein heavy chain 1